ncbi:MAG TPA: adenylate/guanylate cyclase domain-containing protein, partial [Candidatus Margulisiibacteriota bacterium]|nr:adenylate/guanylate cyclase domain-containing protein [Candidatus Margulisiibacteriota bacterium]
MSFVAKLQRAREVLEQQGRLSVRALSRELALGNEELEELIEELVDVQRVALREGNVLVCLPASVGSGQTPFGSSTRPPPRAADDLTANPPPPRAYTPKHLADKILMARSALEGERKQVTVLFADVKGSMELAEQLDPEQWHSILDRFFAILTDGVHRFEGTVNQYPGEGIMALFGAPIAHEDHAQRACLAALHLRDTLRAYGEELRRTHSVSFSARVGLNSGAVIVGKIGDDLRMDYTAQGHTVGLAQRMEQLAEPGVPYLTRHTARLVDGYMRLRSLGEFTIKGAKEPLPVYALEGLGPLRTRFDLSRA